MITTSQHNKKLFLLDAYALIYRAYFAFIKNPRMSSKGLNTSTMLGFTNTLEMLLTGQNASHMAVVFDVHADTFRHEMYPEYKANREQMPEDIRFSIPHVREIIKAYNIPIVEKAGFEADDVIGTLARLAAEQGFVTYMMTPDKDYCQLVDSNTLMFKPGRSGNEAEIWGVSEVLESFQVSNPLQVIDVLGLMGDASDNVPGCPGIGPKTAMKLISDFHCIEGVYENINALKGKMKDNLIAYKDQVLLSKKLVTIDRYVPVEPNWDDFKLSEPNRYRLNELFTEFEFRSLAVKYSNAPQAQVATAIQGSLFDLPPAITGETQTAKTLSDIFNTTHKYIVVENAMQRASLRAELAMTNAFCFDTETTGLDPHQDKLVCISFSFKPHEAYCVLIPKDSNEARDVVQEFRHIFTDRNITKVGQNIKFDMQMLAQYGMEVQAPFFDTMIAHYLLQPDLRHNLDFICESYLGYKKVATEELIGKKGKTQLDMRHVEKEKLADYACEDADLTFQLFPILQKELLENELMPLFTEIEMPLIEVLSDMERTGVVIDKEALNEYAHVLRAQITNIEQEIYELAGEHFLISSPKQLGIILFEKLKIDTNAKKTKTKQYSTGEEILVQLADKHPIINKVLEYRGLLKLLNTYVETLPKLINPRTGRIHTSYNQAVASTGRLSSNNPNLQNIPIRDENGREIRKAFIPSSSDKVYLSADYSQIELRIMADLSNDPAMIEAFNHGVDIHTATAGRIFNIPADQVTSDMRRKAKTANFGIIYGISSFGLAQRLNISRSEAKEIIDGYFGAFPDVKKFMDKSIEIARNDGFVKTLLGRKRYLSDINSANAVVRGIAERNAINAPIQGTAADIIKVAMIRIFDRFNALGLKSKMILQVHDELNFDVETSEIETVKEIVKHEMEQAIRLKIPMLVEMNTGKNWLEAH
jgi:DNA polymerase I